MKLSGERVRERRERLALSMEDVSAKARVSPHTWVRAEHGQEIQPKSARRIAEALGVEPAQLVGGAAPKAPAPPESGPQAEPLQKAVFEEEQHESEVTVRNIPTEKLRERIEFVKGLAEKRQSAIEEVSAKLDSSELVAVDNDWVFAMEAVDEKLDRQFRDEGVFNYVAGVNEGRILAPLEASQRCAEFQRVFSDLRNLTREAAAVARRAKTKNYVDTETLQRKSQIHQREQAAKD